MASRPLIVIVGPTGSGKTAAAVQVAHRVGGEIVTADSMQVYRGMDIGTAKPTPEEQEGVPHHLIDIVAPDEAFSVAQYVALADAAIAEITARGHVPIIAGGTGFYISALVDRWEFPPRPDDAALRDQLRDEAARDGAQALHDRLARIDPDAAARLHPHDTKRVIRALEVYALTGRPLSTFTYKPGEMGRALPYRPLIFGLTVPRAELYARLEARVHAQLAQGLLEEVTRLYIQGYGPELPAMKGITYRQLVGYLRGEYDLATAIDLMVRDNRRYAKRQFTWFSADPRVRWLDLNVVGGASGAARQIADAWVAFVDEPGA